MNTLWQRRETLRLEERERLRAEIRASLRTALAECAPGEEVLVYGSITQPWKFHARSDVDLAFLAEPQRWSIYRMQAELEDRLGRRVDVTLLTETRLREKIEREGERWTS